MTETPTRGRARPNSDMLAAGLFLLTAVVFHFPRLVLDRTPVTFDLMLYVTGAYSFAQALGEGQVIPRWVDMANMGLGEPTFFFFSPLYYYVSAAVSPLVGDVWLATRVVSFLTAWGIGWVAYLIFRRLGAPGAGMIAGICLQVAPIMAFYMVKSIQSYPNMLLGLLIVYCYLLYDHRQAFIDLRPGLLAGLMFTTHALNGSTILMCFFVGAGLAILLRWDDMPARIGRLIGFGLSASLGVGLAMFHLLPAAIVGDHVTPGWTHRDLSTAMFFPVKQFFGAEIRWFTLQWTIPLLLLLLNAAATNGYLRLPDRGRPLAALALPCLLAGWTGLFIGSSFAVPIWEVVTPLQMLQVGGRFMIAITLFSLLGCAAVLALTRAAKLVWSARLAALALAISCLAGFTLLGKYAFVDATPAAVSVAPGDTRAGANYFLPAHAKPAGFNAYLEAGGLDAACAAADAQCTPQRTAVHDKSWLVATDQPVSLRLPVFYFPGWAMTVDGTPATVAPDPDTGLISVSLPPGRSLVRVYWTHADFERLAMAISAGTVVLMLGILVYRRIRRRRAGPAAGGLAASATRDDG